MRGGLSGLWPSNQKRWQHEGEVFRERNIPAHHELSGLPSIQHRRDKIAQAKSRVQKVDGLPTQAC